MRLIAASIAAALWCLPSGAAAYPQFQFSTGNASCKLCHYSPTGGGLLTPWGRGESADTISAFGGNGAFLYGVYEEPDWVRLGADFRVAGLVRNQAGDTETLVFPMLGDTYAYFLRGDWSLYLAVGPRAQPREGGEPVLERFGSREHYAMWRPSTSDWYVRAGRFHAPFGLRSPDHRTYVRRELNLGAFDQTYNLTVGRMVREHELHLSAFTSYGTRFTEAGSAREAGVAGYYEHTIDRDGAAVGAQTRIAIAADTANYAIGAVGKYYLQGPRVLLLGELDAVLQTFDADPGPSRVRLIGYLGASWFPVQGLMVTGAHERYDEDVSVEELTRHGFSLTVQFFPWAKWELIGVGKLELHGTTDRRTATGMLQLHYYL